MDGWTITYIIIALAFAGVGRLAEPALMAAAFWLTLAGLNEYIDRMD